MLMLGPLAFASPWILGALAVLPVIWWLLRVTPPAPRRLAFPAMMFLLGLKPRDETAARTPWWLLALRLLLLALVIIGLAHPLINPLSAGNGARPLLLALDDGWAAGQGWAGRQAAALRLIEGAIRDSRPVLLLTTAPSEAGAAPALAGPMTATEARDRLIALAPKPWPSDRAAVLAALDAALASGGRLRPPADAVFLSDGLADAALNPLLEQLQRLGSLAVATPELGEAVMTFAPLRTEPGERKVTARRLDGRGAGSVAIRAFAGDGRLVAREVARFEAGETSATVTLALPTDLANALTRVDIEGQSHAGAVWLTDTRWQRRAVGLIGGASRADERSLLADSFYITHALAPFAELRRGTVEDLMAAPPTALVWTDTALVSEGERDRIGKFLEAGGIVIRFAGERLASEGDTLLPVTLRPGGRSLGTALAWEQPAPLAPFPTSGPYAGLAIPPDVTVTRQVLAEPTLDLAEKSWARLSDGTPLITAERRGKGWLVLFHVPATADWSNLPLSGLFVDLLRRTTELGSGGPSQFTAPLPAREVLDGFGRLTQPSVAVQALNPEDPSPRIGPAHPPGLYGDDRARIALNLPPALTDLKPIGDLPAGVSRLSLSAPAERDLKPWLLLAALVLLLVDQGIVLALRGALPGFRREAAAALMLGLAALAPTGAHAQADDPTRFAIEATRDFHLAYVVTGNREVDETSAAGLRGLSLVLSRRTAVDTGEPIGVDPAQDELAFFPLLYWPVGSDVGPLSPRAVDRLNSFLRNGGTVLIDTRTEGGFGASGELQRQIRGLDLPKLVPVAPDHVLGKTFYLLSSFPGRNGEAPLWVQPAESRRDEVSSVIVGTVDFAGAWAIDETGRPLHAVSSGDEQQREMAYRVGVNIVMYALTGNYKSDQVHVPAILERLGQ